MSEEPTEAFSQQVVVDGHHQGYREEKPSFGIGDIDSVELMPAEEGEASEGILVTLFERDEKKLGALTQEIVPGTIYLDAAGIIDSAPFLRIPYESGPLRIYGTADEISSLYRVLKEQAPSEIPSEQGGAGQPANHHKKS